MTNAVQSPRWADSSRGLGRLIEALISIGEAQVFAEAVADVVAIQHIGGEPPLEQGCIDGVGQGALARAGEPGEPKNGAAVPTLLRALVAAYGGLMPGDVCLLYTS